MAVETPAGTELSVDAIAERAGRADREGRFARESVAELAAAGALGLAVPERFGGAGAGPVTVADAVERVAAACASTGMVFVMHVVAVQTLAAGTAADDPEGPKHAALAAAASGEHLNAGLLRAGLARALLGAGLAGARGRRRRRHRRRQELCDLGRRGRFVRARVRRSGGG